MVLRIGYGYQLNLLLLGLTLVGYNNIISYNGPCCVSLNKRLSFRLLAQNIGNIRGNCITRNIYSSRGVYDLFDSVFHKYGSIGYPRSEIRPVSFIALRGDILATTKFNLWCHFTSFLTLDMFV